MMVLPTVAQSVPRLVRDATNIARINNLNYVIQKQFSGSAGKCKFRILGIETSCDDTGVAIVDSDRKLLGDAIHNQAQIHLENGGILPPIAGYYHRQNMESVANQAFEAAGLSMGDIDAVAATVKPGLSLSLEVGAKYGCHLSRKWQKPFIPIHHMEAHALTARMIDTDVKFPFLTLLISGGHCLLALVESVDSFLLLGKGLDNSPGDTFDKVYRRLKLRNIPELSKLCGGQAIEVLAGKSKDPFEFKFENIATNSVTCDFSFSGLVTYCDRIIDSEEQKYGIGADEVIPSAANLCAGFQYAVVQHLCRRLERGMTFLRHNNMIPTEHCSLVVSGGVAANKFIAKALKLVCDTHNYHLSIPPPHMCNDNGIMIAWNGVERFGENSGVLNWDQLDSVQISSRCPLGIDIRKTVKHAWESRLKYVKLNKLFDQ